MLLPLIILILLGVGWAMFASHERNLARAERTERRAERQRRRVLHWKFLDSLFQRGPRRLTYRPDEREDI